MNARRQWTMVTLGTWLLSLGPADAQTVRISDAECQALRGRLAEHARLSAGVRQTVASKVAAAPVTTGGAAASAPTDRAGAIRARLEQLPRERQALEDQRLAAMVKFELSRASQIQTQIQALDGERAGLERELASLPAAPSASPPTVSQPPSPDAMRVSCQDVRAAVDDAVKIRRRELGARDDQAGAVPLVALTGQNPDQIGKELAAQLEPGLAGAQVGLLDADGDGRLDGVVDVPAPGTFRLVRQRADGTLAIETFPATGGGAAPAYGELTRRLDESTARESRQALGDLLATRPAGPQRAVTTGDFSAAYAQFQAGNFAEAARLGAAAARSTEFQNARGQSVRVLEVISPVAGGVSVRRAVLLAQGDNQNLWDETTTVVRPASYWRTDVEVARARETRDASGKVIGAPTVPARSTFTLER
jgi:hypothetical protein